MKIYNITLLTDESDISLRELPVKFLYKESKILGFIALFIGGLIFFASLIYLAIIAINGDSLHSALGLIIVSVIFSPLILVGLNLIKKRKELIISNQSIIKKYSTLFKKKEWEEPISEYQGILMRTDVQVTGERSSTLIYALDLFHNEDEKTIRLFKCMEYNTAFNKWKEYCQLFSCQALERVGKDKIIQRDIKNLGKALVDLEKDGSINLFETPPPIPSEVKIDNLEKGKSIILPNKTEILIGKTAFSIKQKIIWKNENKFEYTSVKTVLIDYSKSFKKWGWAIVIVERNSSHRSIFAHDLPYHILEWIQYYLITEINKSKE